MIPPFEPKPCPKNPLDAASLRMIFLPLLSPILALVIGCTEAPSSNIDAEPALAVLGGAILATQNEGRVAQMQTPKPSAVQSWRDLLQHLNPIKEALAAFDDCGAITDVTTASCDGTVLTVEYGNCQNTGFSRAGLWRSYFQYTFPTPGDCTAVLTNGFAGAALTALVGKTVERRWGLGPNGDQNNIRVGVNGEVTYMYSDFPSGWREDRGGGVQITFETTTRRRINVQGVQAKAFIHNPASLPTPTSDFDLVDLPTENQQGTVQRWDHTINTVTIGDSLFEIGPTLTQAGSGAVSFGPQQSNTTATFNGEIVVEGTTVQQGATLLVQHNISQSIGVLVVTEPLTYTSPSCCWPSSGTVRAEYDRNLKAPTLTETVVFTGTECGAIRYTSSVLTNEPLVLSHCL